MAEKTSPKKKKRPTAAKRDIRNDKHRVINKTFKSRVRTSIRNFEKALNSAEDKQKVQEALNTVYSLLDKCVKRGIYKKNKVGRSKGRLTVRMTAKFAS